MTRFCPPKPSSKDRLCWGEIHGHTEMSDGSGDFADLYRHVREVGCLDFAAAADHACYFSDNEWLWMQDVTNSWNRPDEFVTLVGYEWAGRQVHRNVYTARPRLRLFRGMYQPQSSIDTVWNHFHGDEKVVGEPHAPQAHGLIWEHHDPDVERFVEIVRGGTMAFCRRFQDRDVEFRWEDPQRPVGEVYYYLHAVQRDGQEAWSSPIWIRRA